MLQVIILGIIIDTRVKSLLMLGPRMCNVHNAINPMIRNHESLSADLNSNFQKMK
jgi:hypothetical protein